ncbi:MAG: FliH/SctL family protein [Planctomycetota bacterium]
MAVLKRADADISAKSAVVLDLRDLADQGRRLRQEAQQDAEKIRTEARAERERLIADAADEGHRSGLERGRAEGFDHGREQGRAEARAEAAAKLQSLDAAWAKALDALGASQREWREAARAGVLNLSLEIARRVTRRVVELDPRAVDGPLEAALELVAAGTRPVICVNPADEEAVRDGLPRLARRLDQARDAELLVDEDVSRGSCVVRTAGQGTIDADIETQLERIVDALRPPPGVERVEPIESVARDGTGEDDSSDGSSHAAGGTA